VPKVTRTRRTEEFAKKTTDRSKDQLPVEQWLAIREEAELLVDQEIEQRSLTAVDASGGCDE
jgi:hypothetical protein